MNKGFLDNSWENRVLNQADIFTHQPTLSENYLGCYYVADFKDIRDSNVLLIQKMRRFNCLDLPRSKPHDRLSGSYQH